jgi:hypothetical protein
MQLMDVLSPVAGCALITTLLGFAAVHAADPPEVRSLAKGAFSGIQDARQKAVKNRADWEKLWTEHTTVVRNAPPVPQVDFSKEMVIVATLGTRRTGGYAVEIVGARPVAGKFQVTVRRTSPPPGAIAIQALTAPFHFAAVARSDLEIEFVEAKPSK